MFQAVNICKAYHTHTVLDRVSFSLAAGECLGVVGENGSGKSTLLGILAQTGRADSGDIRYRGKSVLADKQFLRRKLGYVPQGCDLLPELTCAQMLRLWLSACGCSGPIPEEVADALGIGELNPIKIGKMSGGMRRRVSIAMALSTGPEILIMDEATTGLDAAYRASLLDWLEGYLSRGGRMVWCSHHPEEIQRLCKTVLTL